MSRHCPHSHVWEGHVLGPMAAASRRGHRISQEVIARFGDSSAIKAYEAMHLMRQTGSLEDYLSLFEERVAQLLSLAPEHYLGTFLGGLQPSIHDRLPDSELTNVFVAIRVARRLARVGRNTTAPSRSGPPNSPVWSRPTTTFQRQPATPEPAPGRVVPNSSPRNSQRLTSAHQEEYRAKGLCFRCGGKYGPLHKCPPKMLAIILDVDEEEDDFDADLSVQQSLENPPALRTS